MTLLKKALNKSFENQRNSIVGEINQAGLALEDCIELREEDTESLSGLYKGSAKALTFGGNLEINAHQIYITSSKLGKQVYIQPYAGIAALPGEHHAIIAGNFNAPFAITPSLFGKSSMLPLYSMLIVSTMGLVRLLKLRSPKIVSPCEELLTTLDMDKNFMQALNGIKFEWGVGASIIRHQWGVQVKPLGNGYSHVVLKSGRYGGLLAPIVGVQKFAQLCKAISICSTDASVEAQDFIYDPTYQSVAQTYLAS